MKRKIFKTGLKFFIVVTFMVAIAGSGAQRVSAACGTVSSVNNFLTTNWVWVLGPYSASAGTTIQVTVQAENTVNFGGGSGVNILVFDTVTSTIYQQTSNGNIPTTAGDIILANVTHTFATAANNIGVIIIYSGGIAQVSHRVTFTCPLTTTPNPREIIETPPDQRLNWKTGDTTGVIYADTTNGIQVYAVGDPNSTLAAHVTPERLAEASCPSQTQGNQRLDSSADRRFVIYYLTTCEFQVNIGPFGDDGKVQVTTWTGIPPTNIKHSEFFINP